MRAKAAVWWFLGLLWLLAAPHVWAAPVTIDWDLPTTYVDGTPLPGAAIARTRIEYGTCAAGGAFGVKAGEFSVAGGAVTATSPNLAPGTWCFRAYTTANGVESPASNVASKVVPQPAPSPPTIRAVAVVAGLNMAPLYRINPDGSRGGALLGFVPVGSACAGPVVYRYRNRDYRRPADFSLAKWEATTPTTNAAAPCG
jgi:hypothetical protein